MSAGARHGCLDHAAVFHRGPDELARRVAPALAEAVAVGDAVLVSLGPDDRAPLEQELGDLARHVTWLHADDRYASPAGAMLTLHRFIVDAVQAGAPAVWSVGALRFDGSEDDERWIRYEHAVNDVLGDLPVRALCSYDLDAVPPDVLAHALAAHPVHHGHAPTVDGPVAVPPAPAVAVPGGAPVVDEAIDRPAAARACIAAALGGSVAPEVLEDLRLVTSELATNALRHGQPPTRLVVWHEPDAVVVQVRDAGTGVTDPYAELRPPHATGGRGLNMVAQLGRLHFDHDGTTATSTARLSLARAIA